MSRGIKRSELLFYVAYILWLVFAVIKLTYLKELIPFKEINGYVEKAVIVLLLLKWWDDDKYGFKGIVGMVVVGVLYYVSIQAQAPGIMIPIYFVYSARNLNYKDIFKVTMIVQFSVMAVSVFCSLNGVILNEVWDEQTRARYSLGYTFCTYGSHISFFLTLLYMSIRKNLYFLEMVALLGWNVVWFRVTDTRIDLLLCVPAIVGCFLLPRIGFQVKDTWVQRVGLMVAGPVMAGVAIAAQWFYDGTNAAWMKVNEILNGRLQLGYDALQEYDVNLLGQYIKWVGRGGVKKHPDWIYNYVDCSYLKYLLHYGLFFFGVLILAIVIVGFTLPKKQNLGLVIAYLFWLIYGMIDAELFELSFQPIMLLLGSACLEVFATRKIGKVNRLTRGSSMNTSVLYDGVLQSEK